VFLWKTSAANFISSSKVALDWFLRDYKNQLIEINSCLGNFIFREECSSKYYLYNRELNEFKRASILLGFQHSDSVKFNTNLWSYGDLKVIRCLVDRMSSQRKEKTTMECHEKKRF